MVEVFLAGKNRWMGDGRGGVGCGGIEGEGRSDLGHTIRGNLDELLLLLLLLLLLVQGTE